MTEQSSPSAVRLLLVRGLLVLAVLAGLGAMHVLGSPGPAHASMPMAAAAAHAVAAAPPVAADPPAAGVLASPLPGGRGAGDSAMMVDCVLFAATGAALLGALLGALLAGAAARRRLALLDAHRVTGRVARWLPARRGPPGPARPRIALCVIRT